MAESYQISNKKIQIYELINRFYRIILKRADKSNTINLKTTKI